MSLLSRLVATGIVATGLCATATVAAAEPTFGVVTDVGVPDGAMVSLVFRPLSFLRAHAGAGYNAISTGYRGGVTLSLPFWFSPTASISYGRYPEGDANPLAQRISGDPDTHSALLEKVGYQFADGYVGLQFGRRRVALQLEAGYSRIEGKVRNLDAMTSGDDPDASTTVSFRQDPDVVVWSVSARLGLTVYVK
ncbi:MAG TPA: hypothetical protein VHE35_36425 [Kofleriaceae bacterium]|nr:hypothetical protein [Kofleriaceae bacterium]